MKKRSDYPRVRKQRYRKWLDACYAHLLETDEMRPAEWLLQNIEVDGRYVPRNVNSATQKLLRDKRFHKAYIEGRQGQVYSDGGQSYYRVLWWGANP